MIQLEQDGIFKVRPLSWEVREAESGALAISFSFKVLEELCDGEWASWEEYDEHQFYGDWWIIKKDGTVNTAAVEQLSKSLGWNGLLSAVEGPPPDRVVQVTVKADEYKGTTRYKGAWMNPEDHTGGSPLAATKDRVKDLDTRFGSLLRAAASSSGSKPGPRKAGPKKKEEPAGGPKKEAPKEPLQGDTPHRDDATPEDPCLCKKCLPF